MRLGHDVFCALHEGYRLRSVWQDGGAHEEPHLVAGGYLVKHRFDNGTALFGFTQGDVRTHWPGTR